MIGLIVVVINLVGSIPAVENWITITLFILAHILAGVLAASFLVMPGDSKKVARQGALASVFAAFVGGVVNTIINLSRVLTGGFTPVSGYLQQQYPDFMTQFPELETRTGLITGGILCGSVCCLFGIAIAAALGAAGAVLYTAVKARVTKSLQ